MTAGRDWAAIKVLWQMANDDDSHLEGGNASIEQEGCELGNHPIVIICTCTIQVHTGCLHSIIA